MRARRTTLVAVALLTAALLVAVFVLSGQETQDAAEAPPAVRFGVVADVQYGDKEDNGIRRYRAALPALALAVDALNAEPRLDFVVQLGDIIDGRETADASRQDLDRVLEAFGNLEAPLHHVVGNHCLAIPRPELERRLGLGPTSWSSFVQGGYRFITVDTMIEDNPAVSWNGGLGPEQRAWLRDQLDASEVAGERALIFAHHPLVAEASDPENLAYDHEEVLAILDESPAAALWMNGHDHRDGYAMRGTVHHVTLAGIVEAAPGQTNLAVVELRPDGIDIIGFGDVSSRRLELGPRR